MLSLPSEVAFYFGFILAFVLSYGLQAVIVDPFATCMMINDYYKAIEGQPLKADLHGTLCDVSKKFRSLFEKSKEPQAQAQGAIPAGI